jgi:hypothetical protein
MFLGAVPAMTGLVAVTAAVMVAPKPAHADSIWYAIVNVESGKPLQSRTNALGSGIIQQSSTATTTPQGQKWLPVDQSDLLFDECQQRQVPGDLACESRRRCDCGPVAV